jgi:hypothetical protein
LFAAVDKRGFQNFVMQSWLDEEELNLEAGKSPLDARLHANGWGADQFPVLADLKRLVRDVGELQKNSLNAGNTKSTAELSQLGLCLAAQLQEGEGGKLMINQLVGIASTATLLRNLDQGTPYDFLGGRTPKEVSEELKQQKVTLVELSRSQDKIFPSLSETEMMNFIDRERILGEVGAMRWLQQRYGTNAP